MTNIADESEELCMICMEITTEKFLNCKNKCQVIVHKDCLYEWVSESNNKCLICKEQGDTPQSSIDDETSLIDNGITICMWLYVMLWVFAVIVFIFSISEDEHHNTE